MKTNQSRMKRNIQNITEQGHGQHAKTTQRKTEQTRSTQIGRIKADTTSQNISYQMNTIQNKGIQTNANRNKFRTNQSKRKQTNTTWNKSERNQNEAKQPKAKHMEQIRTKHTSKQIVANASASQVDEIINKSRADQNELNRLKTNQTNSEQIKWKQIGQVETHE